MPRKLLIDTDTASDDAVALIMALKAPDIEVLAITTVAGNVVVEQAARNALYVSELCGADVPVYSGAGKPLLPLTNLALAVARRPDLVGNVSRVVVMGGNPCCEGNVTPAAEYNFWVDPEAARMVLRSGLPIELVGWQLCRGDAALRPHDIEHVLSLGTQLASFTVECNSTAMEAYRVQTGEMGISLPDPVAMSIALDPGVCTLMSEHPVTVEVGSELTRGMTVVDRLSVAGDIRNRDLWQYIKSIKVCWTIDVPRWKRLLYASLVA